MKKISFWSFFLYSFINHLKVQSFISVTFLSIALLFVNHPIFFCSLAINLFLYIFFSLSSSSKNKTLNLVLAVITVYDHISLLFFFTFFFVYKKIKLLLFSMVSIHFLYLFNLQKNYLFSFFSSSHFIHKLITIFIVFYHNEHITFTAPETILLIVLDEK